MTRTNFFPLMNERDSNELIGIAHSDTEFWQQEAINQAKEELNRRKVSKEYKQKLLASWEKEYREYESQREIELKRNEYEKYSTIDLIRIFFISPLILVGKVSYDMSITELKEENFIEKVKQRKFALVSGMTFYILTFYILINT